MNFDNAAEHRFPLPRKRAWKEERLRKLAYTDPLTGLGNRRLYNETLAELVKRPEPFAILMVDLDRFKKVNDKHGHSVGDIILVQTASDIALSIIGKDIQELTRHEPEEGPEDLVIRWGGEEIAAILYGVNNEADLRNIAERVRSAINETPYIAKINNQEHSIPITVSIGGVVWHPGDNIEDVNEVLDSNLYEAKNTGRNKVVV